MYSFKITANIIKCSYPELDSEEKRLIDAAKDATQRSYSPYSGFRVGAAVVLSNGEIITGNNQENVAFPSGSCAERTAVFYACSLYPEHSVIALAVAAYTGGEFTDNPVSPCGSCRQVLLETEQRYCCPVKIYLYGKQFVYIVESVKDLLPLSFDSLQR
ncbi:MAG: cytidine deaminase [Dysgonamonadaceae bacterium]|jgi:cytidine deaminase|nr:cytidine deaminase [Dysgonamonadaceae bacterium]